MSNLTISRDSTAQPIAFMVTQGTQTLEQLAWRAGYAHGVRVAATELRRIAGEWEGYAARTEGQG